MKVIKKTNNMLDAQYVFGLKNSYGQPYQDILSRIIVKTSGSENIVKFNTASAIINFSDTSKYSNNSFNNLEKYESVDHKNTILKIPELAEKYFSDQKKFLVSMNPGIHSLLYNLIPKILKCHTYEPFAKFIIDTSLIDKTPDSKSIINMLSLILSKKSIDFQIQSNTGKIFAINNFAVIDLSFHSMNQHDLREASKFYQEITDIKTNNEFVYLSRRLTAKRIFENVPNDFSFSEDNRIINEDVLENFFKQIGFSVISPEEFSSPEEQISYFKNTKILVSATSSGIANSMFMKPGGTIIEFVTSFLDMHTEYTEEAIHMLYNKLAYMLGLNYVGIPNYDRDANTIISNLQEIKNLANAKYDKEKQ